MKISVIVPVYNCDKYLSDCLESILRQTYRNLEVVLIDDGSTDASLDICKEYADKDNRIIVYHQENKGVSAARNKGLELATGELISFIDSDDTIDPDMYEVLIELMKENDADISHCGYKHIVGEEVRVVSGTDQVYVQDKEQALNWLINGYMFSCGLCNKLFKNTIAKSLKFDEELKINEDKLFNFFAFSMAEKIVFADVAKYNYFARLGVSACFKTPSDKKISDGCEVCRRIYEKSIDVPALRDSAASKYVDALCSYYLFAVDNLPLKCKEIKKSIKIVISSGYKINKKTRIKARMVCYFTLVYKMMLKCYRKYRKPNWEVIKV